MTTFHIITLFPESLSSYINESIIGRAQTDGVIRVRFYNPRDFVVLSKKDRAKEKPYKRTDGKPYGGGPGMVMEALPVVKAIEKALKNVGTSAKAKKAGTKIIFLSPAGKQFTNEYARTAVKKFAHLIIVCGRYEGVDARIKKIFKMEEVSVGPYVLTGGELGAMILIDTMARQIEGVLGNFDSLEDSRVSSSDVYTRPEVITYKGKNYRVPKVLLSGDHKKIEEWKRATK